MGHIGLQRFDPLQETAMRDEIHRRTPAITAPLRKKLQIEA
jgi:hypothetical protein